MEEEEKEKEEEEDPEEEEEQEELRFMGGAAASLILTVPFENLWTDIQRRWIRMEERLVHAALENLDWKTGTGPTGSIPGFVPDSVTGYS